MIAISQLNAAPDEEFVSALGGIYEHSDWVARQVSRQRPFLEVENLRRAMRQAVEDASEKEQLELIRAHPDLAGKLARAGTLTAASKNEQAGLGLDRLSDEEFRKFSQLNQSYREKFGFPFIICARLTTKRGVIDAFENRELTDHLAK